MEGKKERKDRQKEAASVASLETFNRQTLETFQRELENLHRDRRFNRRSITKSLNSDFKNGYQNLDPELNLASQRKQISFRSQNLVAIFEIRVEGFHRRSTSAGV